MKWKHIDAACYAKMSTMPIYTLKKQISTIASEPFRARSDSNSALEPILPIKPYHLPSLTHRLNENRYADDTLNENVKTCTKYHRLVHARRKL